MDRVYFAIFEHMAIGSCFLLGLGDHAERGRYLGALCICYVLGAPLYLLMPAAGPAYFDGSAYGFLRQQHLVTSYVQGLLFRNTTAINGGAATSIQTWGYIACMPSLHMAHELVMLYYARRSRIFFAGTLVFFLMTAVSVVGLGWHYPTDILGGMVLGAVAIFLSGRVGARMFPRTLRDAYAASDPAIAAAEANGDVR
jgi:membrane-associated phospholipid phosphatase